MKCRKLFYFFALVSGFILSGCAARTYTLERDRIDQELTGGNRGYIFGKAPVEEKSSEKKGTREVRVFEVELGRPYEAKGKQATTTQVSSSESSESESTPLSSLGSSEESTSETVTSTEPETTGAEGQKYTVEKNDTLQKISKKFYGTTKKWVKIYEANKDVLKSPNSVYPGQTLTIPGVSGAQETLKEPKENLK